MENSVSKKLLESRRNLLEILRRLSILSNEYDARGVVGYIAGFEAR